MNREDVEQKVSDYRNFLQQTLRPQLSESRVALQSVQDEIQAYKDLLQLLQKTPQHSSSSMTVDLGWNKAYCEAQITPQENNTPWLFMDVGMGFHIELTPQEAQETIPKRLAFLQCKYSARKESLRKIEEHVTTAQDILDHLHNEALSMP